MNDMQVELLVQHGGTAHQPAVVEGVTWETERRGAPGRLEFTALRDAALQFEEGDPVRLRVGGQNIFYGFVFDKKSSKSEELGVLCYDQLRYLKNKDTYVLPAMTADGLVQLIAADFMLQCGNIANTGYTMEPRIEDGQTLFDMIQNALDLTVENTGQLYCLYDDFGKLALQNVQDMRVGLLIDVEGAEDFDYTTSIDEDTYNVVKLAFDSDEEGQRNIYLAQDSGNIAKWGKLQYFDAIREETGAAQRANELLTLYNRVQRRLSIKGAFGDLRVRAGCSVMVNLSLADRDVQGFMVVERCKHTFEQGHHTMDLTLAGGGFIG